MPYSRLQLQKRKYKPVPSHAATKRRQLHLMSFFIVVVFVGIMLTIIAVDIIFVNWDKQRRSELYSSDYIVDEQPQWSMIQSAPAVNPPSPNISVAVENAKSKITAQSNQQENGMFYGDGDHWQKVIGYSHKFYVYSAYYDDRQGEIIRIIAATITKFAGNVNCLFYYDGANSTSFSSVRANFQAIRENWNLRYSAFFLSCPLQNGRIPSEVSVIRSGRRTTNRLNVHIHEDSVNHDDKSCDFAVCVKPIHYGFDNYKHLIEFVEFNRILGVDHFIFYNSSIGPAVNCILQNYVDEGVVTALPWNLDIKSQHEIRTEGQFAAWNDCIYRVMNRYKYAIMIDLDEMIIPHQNNDLIEMIDSIHNLVSRSSSNKQQGIGAYSFMNNFFYQTWSDDPASKNLSQSLITLRKTRRKKTFTRHKIRSKCIVAPLHVTEVGNHFVWAFQDGWSMINVPRQIGFSHHYRHICEFGGTDCLKGDSTVDNRTYQWSDSLLVRFSSILKRSYKNCFDET